MKKPEPLHLFKFFGRKIPAFLLTQKPIYLLMRQAMAVAECLA